MKTNNNPLAPLGVGFFIGAIAIGTVVIMWNHDREPVRTGQSTLSAGELGFRLDAQMTEPRKSAPLAATVATGVDPVVTRVASRFICSCGTCGEKRLDVCSCETAQQERAFIQDQLRNGRSEEEATQALKQKYGGLKS